MIILYFSFVGVLILILLGIEGLLFPKLFDKILGSKDNGDYVSHIQNTKDQQFLLPPDMSQVQSPVSLITGGFLK